MRRNGLGIRSPPPEHTAASSNNLQLPMGDRHRSASPFGGSGGGFSRAQSPRSPHLSPYMATQGLLSPPAASFNNGAFNSFDSAGSSERANIPIPSPGADSSWSYSVEEADVARQKAEKAARQRQGSVASSIGHRTTHVQPDELRCRGKRKTKRDDNATYRRGDDEFEPDSDDNPDPTAGVVQNGGLRPRHRSTGIDLGNGPQAFKPPTRKGQSATMAAVPEDEGLEQEDFDHYDDGDDGDNGMTPTAGQPRSPMHYQVLVPDTTLPQTYRQPTQWEHLMHDAQRWGRGCLDLARASKNGAFVVLLLAALLWWSFLLRSSPAAPASKVAPQPLPDNFNAFAGRLGELETSYAKSQSDIAGTWDSLDDRLSRLEAEQYVLSDLKQQQAAVMADNRRTKEQMGATIGRVDKLEHRVDSLEKHVSKAINDGSLRDALRRILPDTVPALRSKGGGWDIDDGFFAVFVKRLLYGSGSLEQEIRHLVNQGVAVESKRWAGDRHGDAKRLEERVAQMLDSHGSDVLVGRDDFITIFEDKIQELWRELKSVEANAQTAPTAMKIKTSDGEDLTGMMQSLIDASLLRHSNDQLGRVDYALFSAGARVIEATTTPTLQISGVGLLGRIWGAKPLLARQPRVALHPDTTVGQCWAFAGSSGDLGVMLSEPNVVIDAITIDHVAKAIVTDISSAPRDIEVVSEAASADRRGSETQMLMYPVGQHRG